MRRFGHAAGIAVVFAAALALGLASGPASAQVEPPITVPPPPGAVQGTTAAQSGTELVGLFGVAEGQCGGEGVEQGSWFRMIDPGGGYVENNDSPCDDKTWTPLAPGSDGGLLTGEYQEHPDPAFDGNGGGTNDKITEPASFFGVNFSTATNQVDPQTETEVPPPSVTDDGSGSLSGDVRAFAAAWSNQHFNQGSPKPDGSRPGDTAGPSGELDDGTGAYTLEWKSLIQGGPFNGFTGVWHLEGTFESRATGSAPSGEEPQPSSPPDDGAAAPAPSAPGAPAAPSAPSSGAGSGRMARTGAPLAGVVPLALAVAGLGGLAVLRGTRRARP